MLIGLIVATNAASPKLLTAVAERAARGPCKFALLAEQSERTGSPGAGSGRVS